MFLKLLIGLLLTLAVSATAYAQIGGTDSTAPPAATTPPKTHSTKFTISPSLDVSITSDSKEGSEVLSGDWLAALTAKIDMEGQVYQFASRLDATYGEHISEDVPQKTQDDLILSFTPSRMILPSIGLRLFLEVSGETQFTEGMVDSSETNFLDPLFVYQSLFLGKKISWTSDDGNRSFDMTAGVGYALQQTVAKNFLFRQNRNIQLSQTNPLKQADVTIESGYCALVDVNYSNTITNDLQFTAAAKTVALTKDQLTADFNNARITSIFSVGFQYLYFNLSYNGHLVYDPNVSLERELTQFLGFGFKANW
jgi:hypothetical protein